MIVLFAIGVLAAQAAAPASGAQRIGLSAAAQVALHRYGQCIAERAGMTATGVLKQDFTSRAYHDGLRSLLDNNRVCVPNGQTARFSGVLGAGAVAEGLLAKRDGVLLKALEERAAAAPDTGFSPSDTAAICVVKRDVAGVRGLFAAAPASADEQRAITALAPVVSQCLPAGQDFRFNRPGLRAILALSAFRIAAGAAPAKQG